MSPISEFSPGSASCGESDFMDLQENLQIRTRLRRFLDFRSFQALFALLN